MLPDCETLNFQPCQHATSHPIHCTPTIVSALVGPPQFVLLHTSNHRPSTPSPLPFCLSLPHRNSIADVHDEAHQHTGPAPTTIHLPLTSPHPSGPYPQPPRIRPGVSPPGVTSRSRLTLRPPLRSCPNSRHLHQRQLADITDRRIQLHWTNWRSS